MTVTVYSVPRERTSPRFARAFAFGCKGRITTEAEHVDGPIAMFGSPHIWGVLTRAQEEGRAVYYGDHAYFGRQKFYRITKDAYQHDGRGRTNGLRFRVLGIDIEPWKTGRHILVCPPDRNYARLHGLDETAWIRGTLRTLRRHTDRPVRLRMRNGAERNPVSLRDALRDAHALVTHHSNAAVEALCMGVPVFVTGECAARSMGGTDLTKIETPEYPDDRKRWAGVLADNQWTLDEMRRGMAWRHIR